MSEKRTRAVVFVDGSNFYHGMKHAGVSPSGLDYARLSEKLTGDREWIETRFYVGKLKQEGNSALYRGQRQFLKQLSQQERVRIFLGRMESIEAKGAARKLRRWLRRLSDHPDGASVSHRIADDLRRIAESEERQWVEKAVDVMIATDMVSMAHKDAYDVAYLLSADGDFVPVIDKVRETGRKVFVASAAPGYELFKAANTFIRLKRDFFHGCWM